MDSHSLLLTVGVSLYAVCATFTLMALWNAPDGYEDETGFHFEPKRL